MTKFGQFADLTSKFPFRANKTLTYGAIGGLAVLATLAPLPAMAHLVFAGQDVVGGAGFGALPRALTIQSHGPGTNTESGCIAPGPVAGGCVAGSVGGDEAPPIGFPKQAAPSLSSLGIIDASQIGILFDAVQPQNANNATVTINDLTLKLYNGATLLTTAVLSPEPMTLATNPGNGKTDYLFVLDATEEAAFDAQIAGNFLDVIALDSTISFPNQSSGPDSYALINTNQTPITRVPEPGSLGLVALGLFGLAKWRRAMKR
jgi:PEP-CTERM motif